ncbi:MAG TPA: hypothetical protein VGZ73_25960 [Bryobacteraceae bacterium]|jgi:hypothetical protein|nr:hypothetical protein [Bryobacteraceae bacterium]
MGATRSYLVWIAFFLSAIGPALAAIRFDGFASTQGLRLVGDAAVSGGKVLRLTPARPNRSGAVWFIEKQHVGSGFDTTFQFRLTRQGGLGHGADGVAFVLQNSGPSALGGRGSAGGFAVADANFHPKEMGIPWSIAVALRKYEPRQSASHY